MATRRQQVPPQLNWPRIQKQLQGQKKLLPLWRPLAVLM